MKRKVIQLAKKTLVVSLPIKWTRKIGLNKGDEVNVEERDNALIVSSEKIKRECGSIEVNLSGSSPRAAEWVLSALHKKGYDEIKILYDNERIAKLAHEVTRDLFVGFAVMQQSINSCTLKSIATESEEEFNKTLRRAFLVTLNLAENSLELIKEKKYLELKEILALEQTNNQFTNFGERILNKSGAKDPKNTCFLYIINWNLEKVCDEYRYICEYLSENDKLKLSKDIINVYESCNKLFRLFYETFYKFDIDKLNYKSQQRKSLKEEIKTLLRKSPEKERILLIYLFNLAEEISRFSPSTVALNI